MKKTMTKLSIGLGAIFCGLVLAACAGGGGSSGGSGGAAGSASAGQAPPATGPDLHAPAVEIRTPARGAHLAPSARIQVEGTAADGPGESGLQTLTVNGQMAALFFPALAGLFPPGQSVPMALRLEPQLPPVVQVQPGQSPLQLSLGELWVTVLLDFGTGYTPLLTASLHVGGEASIQLGQSALRFVVDPQSLAFEADLLSSAVPLPPEDVEQFLQSVVPVAIAVSAQMIRPIQVPTVQGLGLVRGQLFADGPARDFVTVSGDVR